MLGSIVQTEDVVDGFKLLGVELRWLSVEELARYNAELEPDRSPILKAVAVGAAGLPSGSG